MCPSSTKRRKAAEGSYAEGPSTHLVEGPLRLRGPLVRGPDDRHSFRFLQGPPRNQRSVAMAMRPDSGCCCLSSELAGWNPRGRGPLRTIRSTSAFFDRSCAMRAIFSARVRPAASCAAAVASCASTAAAFASAASSAVRKDASRSEKDFRERGWARACVPRSGPSSGLQACCRTHRRSQKSRKEVH